MPVTAKLSRKFYERLGDDIAGELVDWFNAVDSTYQAQLREVNDLNWERFNAQLRAEGAEIRREMDAVNARLGKEIRAELSDFRTELSDFRTEILKWMFVYWTGSVFSLGGLIIVLLKPR